ncbi:restriction endonuclease subunit S [Brevibacterium linens]|uniref:restriction endonuclease subunit S n=1 Tax=Brevibacterium linens TaxID=1703 RepID=UPI000FCCC7E8|nr:restriction endonuclease subunit S [Brevibacterium linens]AZT99552.1 restriction endonuclease subunit S [Brevibacterium linens]
MSETVSLQDVCKAIVDCEHKTAPEDPNGMFFAVGTPSMKGNQIDYSQARRISEETFAKWTRRLSPEIGDLLLAREAPVGPVVRIPQNLNVAPGQRTVLIRPNSTEVNAEYLYYLLSSPIQQAALLRYAEGSTVPHLNVSDVRSFALPRLPGLVEQRAIAEVLGALDDKIAANERVSSTVDNLIRFEYLSLKGEHVPLGDLAKNVRDQVKPEVMPGEAIYLGLEHLPREHFWVTGQGNTSEITSAKARFEEGDVLFGKLRPYFHKVVSAPFGGVCSTDILVIRAMEADLAGLILAAVGSKETVAAAVSSSEGTRMPRTSWKDLSETSIRWPGRSAAVSFSHGVQRRADLAAKLGAESRALARSRDELLPLLMSGKITVKDAEAVVSDAV